MPGNQVVLVYLQVLRVFGLLAGIGCDTSSNEHCTASGVLVTKRNLSDRPLYTWSAMKRLSLHFMCAIRVSTVVEVPCFFQAPTPLERPFDPCFDDLPSECCSPRLAKVLLNERPVPLCGAFRFSSSFVCFVSLD